MNVQSSPTRDKTRSVKPMIGPPKFITKTAVRMIVKAIVMNE